MKRLWFFRKRREVFLNYCLVACRVSVSLFLAGMILVAQPARSEESLPAVGTMPIPTLKDVKVFATTTYDSKSKHYFYRYRIENPASNTGEIWDFEVDIHIDRHSLETKLPSAGLRIPRGSKTRSFDEEARRISFPGQLGFPLRQSVVPVGQEVPPDWDGGIAGALAGFSAGNSAQNILPGKSLDGFVVISPGLPTIRQVTTHPWWILVVEEEATDEEIAASNIVEEKLPWRTYSLGPSSLDNFGSFKHWTQLASDIERAASPEMGWIPSASLAQTLRAQLAVARAALSHSDVKLAKAHLQTLLQTMRNSHASERSQELYDLVVLNVENLLETTPDTPVTFEPLYEMTLSSNRLLVGDELLGIAKILNVANDASPVPNAPVFITIVGGPNADRKFWSGHTDEKGKFTFRYTSTTPGVDFLVWTRNAPDSHEQNSLRADTVAEGSVQWTNPKPARISQESVEIRRGVTVRRGREESSIGRSGENSTHASTETDSYVASIAAPYNKAPDCSAAEASREYLLPLKRIELQEIEIRNVQDPDDDPIAIVIESIRQDEPVSGLDSEDPSPDAAGVGTAIARVRAEYGGLLNGRVYTISFRAKDGKGGVCKGKVAVRIPNIVFSDEAIDDGARYDSTVP